MARNKSRSAAFLAILLVGLVGVTIFAVQARRQATLNQAEAEKQARIAADNQKNAEAKEAEAQQSEASARHTIVHLLIDSGASEIGEGSNSTALAFFARAINVEVNTPGYQASKRQRTVMGASGTTFLTPSLGDQAFNRQRVGFLSRKIPRRRAILEHDRAVGTADFSRDGTCVLTAAVVGADARVWDARSGRAIAELNGHEDYLAFAVFSPDGTRGVTASQDTTARLWETASGKSLTVLKGHSGTVWSARFSADGRFVATASAEFTARIWDPDSRKSIAEGIGHRSIVHGANSSPDGTHLLTASEDKTAQSGRSIRCREIPRPLCSGPRCSPGLISTSSA